MWAITTASTPLHRVESLLLAQGDFGDYEGDCDDGDADDDDYDDDDDDDYDDARDEFEPNIVLHALSWLRRRYMTQNIFFLRVCAEDGKTGIKSRPTDFPTKAHHGDLISL